MFSFFWSLIHSITKSQTQKPRTERVKKEKNNLFLDFKMGMDSGIEIKVMDPRKGDNVVHPVGSGHATSASSVPQPSTSSPLPDGRRRRQQQEQGQGQRLGQQGQGLIDFKPFKKWVSWMVPGFVLANIVVFVITMFINDCPKNSVSCVAGFLGRFSFQPMKENPLLGPSSST